MLRTENDDQIPEQPDKKVTIKDSIGSEAQEAFAKVMSIF
jgi:hypothetical protein